MFIEYKDKKYEVIRNPSLNSFQIQAELFRIKYPKYEFIPYENEVLICKLIEEAEFNDDAKR